MSDQQRVEQLKLKIELREAMINDTPRYRRAKRTTDMIIGSMRDFLPSDVACLRRIEEHLMEAAFLGNVAIINVPPECDELDKIELEQRMLHLRTLPLTFPKS